MYSQYNNYQQPAAVTSTQAGLQWNGTAWVPSSNPTTTTHSSYVSTTTNTPTNPPAADLVQTYTQYYHLWKAQEEQQERFAETLPEGSSRESAKRQAQWAKHYADQASIAAHHYHNTPHMAPPSLPPAPPGATDATTGVQQTASVVRPQPQAPAVVVQQPQAPATLQQQQNPPETPASLKRHVHKCLQQCQQGNAQQIQWMQKEVEKVIAQALRDGTMHTQNWDARPLIPLPVDTATAVQTSGGTAAAIKKFRRQQQQQQQNSATISTTQSKSSGTHYGPSSSSRDSNVGHYGPSSGAYRQEQQQASSSAADTSYYGPSADDSTTQEDKYKSKYKLQDKFATTPNDYVSSDNYYGNNSKDLGDDDFVSLSRHKISRKRKKLEKKKKKASKQIKVNKQVIMKPDTVKKQVILGSGGIDGSSLALAKRANRFAGAGGISDALSLSAHKSNREMDRFMGLAVIGGSKKLEESDYEHMKVKGRCQKLEKEYLRLTAPPRAELVRPQEILEKHLENLKTEWSAPKRRDYIWFCSQLKAVRQDLTVQQIVNAFAVDVYETHARIALEEGDLNEYNQCQTQLKELYRKLHADEEAIKNENEFIAYRLIYYVFLQGNKKYEGGSSDMFNIMLSLTPQQRQDSFICHALKVRVAVAEYDYHAFFRLLEECSKHGKYLMSYMVPKVRHWALQRMCKAYRPSVSTEHVLRELGFDVAKEADYGKKWLSSCGVVLSANCDEVLTKDSVVRESDLTEKASSLI